MDMGLVPCCFAVAAGRCRASSEPCEGPERVLERAGTREAGQFGPGAPTLARAGNALPFSPRPVSWQTARVYSFDSARYKEAAEGCRALATCHLDSDSVRGSSRASRSGTCRSLDVGRVHLPGPGQPGGRHGPGARRALPRGPRGVRRGRRGAGQKLSALMWEGPEDRADADRERAAGADGGVARGDARARGRSRHRPRARRALRRRPFARRIFGARARPGASRSPMRRGCCASAAAPCSRRRRSGTGAMAALLGLDFAAAAAVAEEAAAGRGLPGGQRQWRRARWWSPATRRRSSGRSRSPGRRAPSGPCCCRCARPSIAP